MKNKNMKAKFFLPILAVSATSAFTTFTATAGTTPPVLIDLHVRVVETDVSSAADDTVIDYANTNAIAHLNPKTLADFSFTVESGETAIFSSTTEYIYPTEWKVVTNMPTSSSTEFVSVEPQHFTMREVGVYFVPTPVYYPETGFTDIRIHADIVEEPTWKNYGGVFTVSSGKMHRLNMTQPFFPTHSMRTTVRLRNGEQKVFGGMMMIKKQGRIVHIAVKAEAILPDGETPPEGR